MRDGYPMHRWVFEDAYGRYDIDLGDSNVECGQVDDLAVPGELVLDYGNAKGTEAMRATVAGMYGRAIDEVGITHGAQEALYLLYRTLLRPGDHVLVLSPGWRQAVAVPELIGCRVEVVENLPTGHPDVGRAVRGVRRDTRMIILNTPDNPTGKRIRPSDVDTLVSSARAAGAYLVLDEEYVVDLADSLAGRYEHAVSVSSVSKVYGLPGLRLGWLCGPADVVEKAMDYKHFTSIANSVLAERLAAQVLDRRAEFHDRYDRLVTTGLEILETWVAAHPDRVRLSRPEGTPFAWVELRGTGSSLDFCRAVLDEAKVLLMPAEVFGREHGFRITFAREPETLRAGLERIDRVLREREVSS